MTAAQAKREALNIMQNVRWTEARDGFIDHENRKAALNAALGMINRSGDNRLKGLAFRAINENNRMMEV